MNKEKEQSMIPSDSTRGMSCRESGKSYAARVIKSHMVEKLLREVIESKNKEA